MDNDRPLIEPEIGSVSIVWLETDPGPCACGCEIGIGAVGFHLDQQEPVCDKCLLGLHKDIGMMMWMTHIVRELVDDSTGVDDLRQRQMALMTFARLYHTGATWPRREAAAMDFMAGLKERLAAVPWSPLTTLVGRPDGH